jgi:hypothetical protein
MQRRFAGQWARIEARSHLPGQSRCFDLSFFDQELDSTAIAQDGKAGEQYQKEERRRQQNGDLPPQTQLEPT